MEQLGQVTGALLLGAEHHERTHGPDDLMGGDDLAQRRVGRGEYAQRAEQTRIRESEAAVLSGDRDAEGSELVEFDEEAVGELR
ncbi:hypothetical protein KACC15558_34220 [Brevibacterium ammoniilyticum]|uniref:Uncharacterized protein n=1 Tax=Brevibacterium ammoniilyticum TaxID=1046555 RepID=A0ABP9UBR7_9MICO